MRRILPCLALLACGGSEQLRPIGENIDLRHFLPDSLQFITPAAGDTVFHRRLTVGPDSARVEVRWQSAQHGGGRYLTALSALVVGASPYDSLTVGDVADLVNVGSKTKPIESAKVRIGWFKSGGRAGRVDFTFDATGKHLVGPASTQ